MSTENPKLITCPAYSILLLHPYVMYGQCTGLALIVIGSSVLSWAAYLSPWMPTWVWVSLTILTGLGVGVAATSAVAAIATVAPKPQAAHRVNIDSCSVLCSAAALRVMINFLFSFKLLVALTVNKIFYK